eukprot:TRINITY_DN1984_c0_g1_i3.p1 TRINITY_DN1984_c0_g1~~TRINITY_DN1984_c0_g1_i3.p1  ORF type:complete len:485 (+),score=101.38 TRINITY_DN1984_c0_g1_i3:74-1528(+)
MTAMLARFVVFAGLMKGTQSQLRVVTPRWLVDKFVESGSSTGSAATRGHIDGSTATYGAPFYGERIFGRLTWGESKKNMTHCTEDDYDIPAPEEMQVPSHSYKEVVLINIAIVRRGRCSFVTKTRVAAKKGAHALIIVDQEGSTRTAKDLQNIVVADDGYGTDIRIPSVLITAADGEKLIDAVKKDPVVVELAWDIPTDHIVHMDLWMSSGSKSSLQFLKDFSPLRKRLNDVVKFTPHYHVFAMGKTDFNDLCSDDTAAFCAEDPDGAGTVTGKMVLEEDIRQLCIHETTKVHRTSEHGLHAYAEKFWSYVEQLPSMCPMEAPAGAEDKVFGRACSIRVMKKVHIDADAIFACEMENKDKYLKQERTNHAWSPKALRINGWRYSGELEPMLVTRAICSAFVKQPSTCTSILKPIDPFKNDVEKVPSRGVNFGTVLGTLAGIGLISCIGLFLYKHSLTRSIHNSLKEEVMLEVQAQMSTYNKLPS